jgi:hypothetical protein
MQPLKLPRRQQQLYDRLLGRGDVAISDLFFAIATLHAQGRPDAFDQRFQQMWLGPYITALNRNLSDHRMRVEPGALKGTYRLTRIAA